MSEQNSESISIKNHDSNNPQASYEPPPAITLATHITERERYIERLHLQSCEIEGIIAPYDLPKKEWLRCGLNNCSTIHGKGYIIRAKDGRETNCGWQCGSREFGAVFDEFVTSYNQREIDRAKQKILRDAKEQSSHLLQSARPLAEKAEEYAKRIQQISELIEKDPALLRKIQEVSAKHGAVEIEERIDGELRRALGTSDKFKITTIAQIKGLSALWEVRYIARSMKSTTVPTLERIAQLSLGEINKDDSLLTLQFSDIKRQIQTTEKLILEAKSLCDSNNIETMAISIGKAMGRKNGRISRALQALERLAKNGFEERSGT